MVTRSVTFCCCRQRRGADSGAELQGKPGDPSIDTRPAVSQSSSYLDTGVQGVVAIVDGDNIVLEKRQ